MVSGSDSTTAITRSPSTALENAAPGLDEAERVYRDCLHGKE